MSAYRRLMEEVSKAIRNNDAVPFMPASPYDVLTVLKENDKLKERIAALERVAEASRNLVGDGPPLKDCGCSYCAVMEALKALSGTQGGGEV